MFEHRYRLRTGPLVALALLFLLGGVGAVIALAVGGMEAQPRKLSFLYDLWPLGAVILQWIVAAGSAGLGLLLLWLVNSGLVHRESLIRVTDHGVTWQPPRSNSAAVTLPLSQVTAVERRYIGGASAWS